MFKFETLKQHIRLTAWEYGNKACDVQRKTLEQRDREFTNSLAAWFLGGPVGRVGSIEAAFRRAEMDEVEGVSVDRVGPTQPDKWSVKIELRRRLMVNVNFGDTEIPRLRQPNWSSTERRFRPAPGEQLNLGEQAYNALVNARLRGEESGWGFTTNSLLVWGSADKVQEAVTGLDRILDPKQVSIRRVDIELLREE